MKPLMLKLQAFGPYAEVETVDFRPAIESGLFGIYGNTGAGKSTLFNAISFALFGQAADKEKDLTTLRSGHAATNLKTIVELIFSEGEKSYLVRRWPSQNRPKLKGEGEIKEPHKAELFDITGIALSDISESNSGTVLKETKAREVDAKIIEILGYGPRQFNQIVLLPQGRFEAFLTAKTAERVAILSELFDVSLYKELTVKMIEKSKEAEDRVRADRQACAAQLKMHDFDTVDELIEGITVAAADFDEKAALSKSATETTALHQKALDKAVALSGLYRTYDLGHLKIQTLEGKKVEMDQVRTNKSMAEKCQLLIEPQKHVFRATEAFRIAGEQLTQSRSDHNAAIEHANRAKAVMDALEQQAGQVEVDKKSAIAYERYQGLLSAAAEIGSELDQKRMHCQDDQTTLDQDKTKISVLSQKQQSLKEKLVAVQANDMERVRMSVEQQNLTARRANALNFEQRRGALLTAQTNLTIAKESAVRSSQELEQEQKRYKKVEAKLSAVQSLHLANKLVDGEACSVCGSLEHPAPANGSPERQGLNEEFNASDEMKTRAENTNRENLTQLEVKKSTLKDCQTEFDACPPSIENSSDLQTQIGKVQTALEALGAYQDAALIQSGINECDIQLAELSKVKDSAVIAVQASKSDVDLAQQAFDLKQAEVPENLREVAVLNNALSALNQKMTTYSLELKAGSEQLIQANQDVIAAAQRVETASAYRTQTDEDMKKVQIDFAMMLKEAEMPEEYFEGWKAHIEHIQTYMETLKNYEQDLAHARGEIASNLTAIDGQARPVLENFNQLRDEHKNASDAAARQATLAEGHHSNLVTLQATIKSEYDRIEKVQKESADVRELASTFNGAVGPRVTLETFAIASMFELVLAAANQRLMPMSRGRYKLERDSDGKGVARRGLGITVFDVEFGTSRPTYTLSGGEKFMAALSLALGLSDVVESLSGNIRLEALFIDEGFGSLDTENDTGTLGDVLQTLTTMVGNTRAVGLISHVGIVKQEIPNGYYIHSGPDGRSTIETRML